MNKPSWGKWGSWEEAEALLGKVIAESEGADAVELGSIRRWLESKEFDCPLHYDGDIARQAGYRDVVAPSAMALTYGLPPYWRPGDPGEKQGDKPRQIPLPVIWDVPAPATLSFATNIDVEYYATMYPGDQISRVSELVSIVHKVLKVGSGAFMRQKDTYTNQHGEKVAVVEMDIFRFAPAGDQAENQAQ